MTTIAVRKYNDRIEIAADSQGNMGNLRVNRQKLFTFPKNGIAFAHCGYAHRCYLFKQYLLEKHCNIPGAFPVTTHKIFNDFRKWALDEKLSLSDSDPNDLESFILVKDGKIYEANLNDTSIEIVEIDNFYAIGSGCQFALAAMEYDKSPKEAVALASKYNLNTGGKIQEEIICIKP